MNHDHCSISEAARKLNTEPHVLRYWEEELNLSIPRNELGHRIYSSSELELLQQILEYKNAGYALFEIKGKLSPAICSVEKNETTGSSPDEKLNQFRSIMNSIIETAIKKNNQELASIISTSTSERIIKELNYLFRTFDEDESIRIKQLQAAISASNYVKNKEHSSSIRSKIWHKIGKA